MTLATYVQRLLAGCPALAAGPFDIAIDNLDGRPSRYSVDAEPDSQVVKRYLGGDTLRRFAFTLSARSEAVGNEDLAETHARYEAVARWAEAATRARALPVMDVGRVPHTLMAVGGPALYTLADDANTAAYRMRMELTYWQTNTQ